MTAFSVTKNRCFNASKNHESEREQPIFHTFLLHITLFIIYNRSVSRCKEVSNFFSSVNIITVLIYATLCMFDKEN